MPEGSSRGPPRRRVILTPVTSRTIWHEPACHNIPHRSSRTREVDNGPVVGVGACYAARCPSSQGAPAANSIALCSMRRCVGMNWQDAALGMAGVIGSCVAVVHGFLVQRLMVRPFEEFFLADKRVSSSIRRLVPLLLAFQHDQLVPWRTRLNRCRNLVRSQCKARDWSIRWQPLLVGCSRQPLGNAWSSSWLDAHGSCGHPDCLRRQQIRRLKRPSPARSPSAGRDASGWAWGELGKTRIA